MDRHTNVELDPASEVEMRELVDAQNLRVVGWYHSHPTFVPNPSMIDLVNQKNYQHFFRSAEEPVEESDKESSSESSGPKSDAITEPFIGVIVGPYDPNLPKSISVFNWFNVGNREEDMNRPKSLVFESLSGQENENLEASDLSKMVISPTSNVKTFLMNSSLN
jgi:hypothetical protein